MTGAPTTGTTTAVGVATTTHAPMMTKGAATTGTAAMGTGAATGEAEATVSRHRRQKRLTCPETTPPCRRAAERRPGRRVSGPTRREASRGSSFVSKRYLIRVGRGRVARRARRPRRKKALTPSPTCRKDYLGIESADAGQYVPFGGIRGAARLVLVLTARRDVGGENLGGGDVLRCEREGVSVRFRRVVLAGKKRKSERTDAPCGSSAGGRRRTQPQPRRARRRARRRAGACS